MNNAAGGYEITHALEGLVDKKKRRGDVEGVGRSISRCVCQGEQVNKYNFLLE